jgi:very-short-patch-repair endonuclease
MNFISAEKKSKICQQRKTNETLTAHLQNRGFSIRLRDSGFVLYLGSQMHFGQKSPASQMRGPLAGIKNNNRKMFIENQISKIHDITCNYIKEYLNLCESEIEKIFLVNLFQYFFEEKFSLKTYHYEYADDEFIEFDDFHPYFEYENEHTYDCHLAGIVMTERKEKSTHTIKFNKITHQFEENNRPNESEWITEITLKKYTFIPQYKLMIEENNYRLDFALIYEKLINDELIKEVKIAIECDGHDFHSTKEQIRKDSIRTRKLMSNGGRVIRYTGSEIYQNANKSEMRDVISEIKLIIES